MPTSFLLRVKEVSVPLEAERDPQYLREKNRGRKMGHDGWKVKQPAGECVPTEAERKGL